MQHDWLRPGCRITNNAELRYLNAARKKVTWGVFFRSLCIYADVTDEAARLGEFVPEDPRLDSNTSAVMGLKLTTHDQIHG